jgi:hypothetical protein
MPLTVGVTVFEYRYVDTLIEASTTNQKMAEEVLALRKRLMEILPEEKDFADNHFKH